MAKMETVISVDVKSNENGTYDAYIATENSSGSHYEAASASEIGENVAGLIDTLEESYTGVSHYRNTCPALLVHTDGYNIKYSKHENKKAACMAMKEAYALFNKNEPDDDWDKMSEIADDTAMLYDRGENVHVWRVILL